MALDEQSTVQAKPVNKERVRLLVRVAVILAIITVFEFILANVMPESMKLEKIILFVAMTIVKAFYIVGEFMHLKYEVKAMIWAILLPMLFVVWLVTALINEGGAIFDKIFH